jgi:hypothetical protein
MPASWIPCRRCHAHNVRPPYNLPLRSVAVTDDGPTAAGISNAGGGPMAVASAGEAVAVSNADTLQNEQGMA